MILFLDDNPFRARAFRRECPSAVFAHNAAGCIDRLMKKVKWDLVLLDHDLEGEYQDSSEANTGMQVVRYIEQCKPTIRRILCHSLNTEAAEEMAIRLRRAGVRRAAEVVQALRDGGVGGADGGRVGGSEADLIARNSPPPGADVV